MRAPECVYPAGLRAGCSGPWRSICNRPPPAVGRSSRLGPPPGGETRISPTAIHSDGMSLKSVLSVANAIPQTRFIGPSWLAAYRHSITAATAPNGSDSLHGLLQQGRTTRLGLATHVEDRDFAIW